MSCSFMLVAILRLTALAEITSTEASADFGLNEKVNSTWQELILRL